MSEDQINILKAWLHRNSTLAVSVGTWGKRSFLRIVAIEPLDDDQEVMYVPLDDVPRDTNKQEMN